MKKKIFTLLLAVAASIGTMVAADAIGRLNYGGLYYVLYTDYTAILTNNNSNNDPYWYSNPTRVTIPSSIEYNNETYTVTAIAEGTFSYCSNLYEIVIPETIWGIGNKAFSYTGLDNVIIPNSVTFLGEEAFAGCSRMTSIVLSEELSSIGKGCFNGCSSLTNIVIPNSVTSIGEEAFILCSRITSIFLSEELTSIPQGCFHGCSSLTSIVIPDKVTSIGSKAFRKCSSLISVTIGNSVTSIGDFVFEDCNGLTSVVWNAKNCSDFSLGDTPFHFSGNYTFYSFDLRSQITSFSFGNNVEHIPAYLCLGMSNMTSLTIGNSVTSIGDDAFRNCTGLTSVTIPNSVTSIGGEVFLGCSGITSPVYNAHVFAFMPTSYSGSYIIPNGIESIAGDAFDGCSGLTSVAIPNSVTSIGLAAFHGCSSLASVTIDANTIINADYMRYGFSNIFGSQVTEYIIGESVTGIGQHVFFNCSGLTSLTIGNSVTNIGTEAFYGCSGLTSITIPGSVTNIGYCAFYGCKNLQYLKFLGENPPSMYQAFINTNDCPFYVPCGTKQTYQSALRSDYSGNNHPVIAFGCTTNTVTFEDWDGAILKTEQVESGHSATAPANPTREGYTFIGWDKDFSNVQYDLTVTAQYTPNTPSATYYTVTFKDWNGTVLKSEQVEEGHSATAPANPTRDGYTFTGWDKDFSNVQSNLTVTAQYQKNETPVTNAITVRLKASSATGWSKVNLYYWANGVTSPAWPGITINRDADGWYSHTFDASVTSVNIIWNDGNNQTADITNVTESTCYSLKSTSGKTIGVNVVECQAAAPISVTGVSLNKKTLQMVVGNTATLTASVLPANANNKSLTWTSSNTATATISSTGTISAKAEGVTTITCKTVDGNFTAECYVVVSAANSEYTFSYEPTNATVISYTATELSYDEVPENNCVFAALADNAHTLNLMYVGSLVNGVIPQGNYKITSTLQNGTFYYSVGGDDQYDYGSYMATDFDSEGYYTSAYYIIAGDITIGSKNNYTVKVVSANGTDINVTYNGTQDVENISSDIKAAKILRDGQILILRGDKTYTLQGQEVR